MSASTTHEKSSTKKSLMKVFWILLAITIVEIIWGLWISHSLPKWINALFFLSLTFTKAGYIVAEFMHLKYEYKSLISTILIPLLIFIWFIIAFCYDGGAWLGQRTKYNHEQQFKPEKKEQQHHSAH